MFKLKPYVERAVLSGELDRERGPAGAAGHVLMLIPQEHREAAFLRALEVCCFVANEQTILGSPPVVGMPSEW